MTKNDTLATYRAKRDLTTRSGKTDDEHADRRRNPARTQPESVLSGRRNADISEDDDA